jgi:hypothetical protein
MGFHKEKIMFLFAISFIAMVSCSIGAFSSARAGNVAVFVLLQALALGNGYFAVLRATQLKEYY